MASITLARSTDPLLQPRLDSSDGRRALSGRRCLTSAALPAGHHNRGKPCGVYAHKFCSQKSFWRTPAAVDRPLHCGRPEFLSQSTFFNRLRGDSERVQATTADAAWTASGEQEGAAGALKDASEDVSSGTMEPELSETESFSILTLFKKLKDAWVNGVLLPLTNFGMGKRSIWEGGVGLFIMSGVVLCALIVGWVRGVRVRAQTTRYQAIFEFGQACGIAVGTPVRIRGVDVGSVVGVRPSLEKIDAVVEIIDDKVVIPRNALIEVNQSGLISETLIDITPQPPIPEPTVGPTNPKCSEEGLIVCDRERIAGQRGVSLDELVGICTKVAKEMDEQGVSTIFEALDKFAALAEQAKPLVEKVNSMATDLKPMLTDLKDGELIKNLEQLSGVALEAAQDIKQLNSNVLSDGKSSVLLRDAVTTLTKTLKNIESISSDLSTMTGDPSTRNHLKSLIESLSRIVVD